MRKISSYILFLLTTMLVGGYFVYLTFSGHITPNLVSEALVNSVRHYPKQENPRDIVLKCAYHGQDLEIKETLYGSVYDYYKSDPKKKSAYYHNNNGAFVTTYPEDDSIKSITNKIRNVAVANSLDNDQTVDLSACFLQGIPYDTDKAARILSPDYYKLSAEQLIARYPYETLYDNIGICTDKSYLGAAVFRELGYGVSLLSFDSQRHMSIGLQVPEGYGDFATGYGIMELTGSNFLVGDIPEISPTAGLAVGGIGTVPNVSTDSNEKVVSGNKLSALSNTTKISDGKAYTRIIARTETKNSLTEMKPSLEAKQADFEIKKGLLTEAETLLSSTEQQYKLSPTASNYASYQQAYGSYTRSYNAASIAMNEYNDLVNKYNNLVISYREF